MNNIPIDWGNSRGIAQSRTPIEESMYLGRSAVSLFRDRNSRLLLMIKVRPVYSWAWFCSLCKQYEETM